MILYADRIRGQWWLYDRENPGVKIAGPFDSEAEADNAMEDIEFDAND